MGASFRNIGEIVELAGCDLLTISPALLESLKSTLEPVALRLDVAEALELPLEKIEMTEERFHQMVKEDAMASEKLPEGIHKFSADTEKLEKLILEKLKKPSIKKEADLLASLLTQNK